MSSMWRSCPCSSSACSWCISGGSARTGGCRPPRKRPGMKQDFPRDKTYGLMAVIRRKSPMVEKGPEDTLASWPHLPVTEARAPRTPLYTALALVGLILCDEYIRVRSLIGRPDIVPGWIIPIVTILGLSLGLYGLVRPLRPSTRELVIAYFTGFIVTYFVLTIVGIFLRGLGMHLALPWELPPGALSF